MKILAFADRSPRESVSALIDRDPPDLIACLGDLRASDMKDIATCGIPAVGVYGNHCLGSYLEDFGIVNVHGRAITVAGLTIGGMEGCVRYKSAPHYSFPGRPDLRPDRQYEQEEADRVWTALPPCDLILSHCPPFGVNDTIEEFYSRFAWSAVDDQFAAATGDVIRDPSHVGWIGGRRYLVKSQPTWWLHGHTYPKGPCVRQILETTVHYVIQDRLIDLSEQPSAESQPPFPSMAALPAGQSWWDRLFHPSSP